MLQDSDHLKLIDFGFAKWGDLILGTAALESTLALAVNQPLLIPRPKHTDPSLVYLCRSRGSAHRVPQREGARTPPFMQRRRVALVT